MRILLTGTDGFIGHALRNKLQRDGHKCAEILRDGPLALCDRAFMGDIRDASLVRRAVMRHRPQVIYHLAAQALVGVGVSDPVTTVESNVIGTLNILEAARQADDGISVVVASSDKAYGDKTDARGGYCDYYEGDPMDGRGIYDCSKSCADLLCRSYAETYKMDVRVARMGNVYGPGDRERTRIVPSLVDDIVNGRRPHIMSDGTPVRDYLYIDDAVDAYVKLGDQENRSGFFQPYNFSGGQRVSVLGLAQLMLAVIHDGHVDVDPSPFIDGPIVLSLRGTREIQNQALDCTKARTRLRWTPMFSLRSGLIATLNASKHLCRR